MKHSNFLFSAARISRDTRVTHAPSIEQGDGPRARKSRVWARPMALRLAGSIVCLLMVATFASCSGKPTSAIASRNPNPSSVSTTPNARLTNCKTPVLVLDMQDKNGALVETYYFYLQAAFPNGGTGYVHPPVTQFTGHFECADGWPSRLTPS